EQILQVFAARAAAELERQRAIVSLEQLNYALEVKVAERTAELQEREQFLQTVLDTFPLRVFWKDLNLSYLGGNRNFFKDVGVTSVAGILGKTDYDMPWGSTHAVHAQQEDRDVIQSNASKLGIERTLIDSDGQQIWIETNKLPLHNLSGEVVGVLGTYQDITERKQLELDLQSSKNQLSEVLDTAISGIVRLRFYPDASMRYEYISPYCAENLGFTVAELLSNPGLWQSRVHPDDWDEVIVPTTQAILNTRETSTYTMEYRFYRKEGTICWILANLFIQWNAAETCWDVTVVDTDISDRKKAEAQLQHLLAGTATTIGQDFFPALVCHIAEALQVTHVLLGELVDGSMHTLAFLNQGELHTNFSYPLENNPCLQTIQKGHFYCCSNIQQQFPLCFSLVEMEAESYVGIALKDQEDQVIGVLCLYHQHPMHDINSVIQILQIFATRASVELERQRASIALEQLNQALEVTVAERMAELREREQFLQTVLNTFPLAVFWKNRQSVYLGCNSNFLANAGLTSLAELTGKTDYDLPLIMTTAEAYRTDDMQVMETNTPKLGIIQTLYGADGQPIWIETNKLPLHNLEGDVIGVLGTSQDISERKRAEIAIKRQLAAMEAAIDGIGILENDAYIYVNKAYLDLFAYGQPEELLGKSWYSLYSTEENLRFERDVLPTLEQYRAWQGEAIATRKDGTTFVQGVSLTLMEDGLLICVCRDISALKQAQAQIIHNALHDPLTGLPNRTLLIERIELAIQTASYLPNYQYALLFLDLDRFKVINDSLGHVVGDQLLVEVSKRLQQCVREIDMVARLGGDEFVILLDNIQYLDDIVHVVERILEDCQTPILIDDQKILTSASIGIALGNKHYHQASTLIRNADIAMYRAKGQESNSYKFFDEVMHAEAVSRLTLETDLRRALIHQEFVVHYQPIVSLWNSALLGFEALVRWQHPTRGLVPPDEFIPVLEDTGLVSSLDSWVMHEACRQMCCWQRQFPQRFPLKISINLSALDLQSTNLLQTIETILQNTELPGDLIVLEITERMLIEDIDKTTDLLIALAAKRIQVSIDDFGTGYSSLSYLHRLPVHHLKIDRSFVSQMHVDNRNYQVVSTILAMSQQLGLAVVAEGIEVTEHLQPLQQLGCQFGQGHLFSPPLTSTEVERLLERSQLTL
ncbi:MAG: EAL domain-containing protein, partial [Cyanobacteria bacterium P01_D01_bin.56]